MLRVYFDEPCTLPVACSIDGEEQPTGTKVWAGEVFNGTLGETKQKRLWLKNDDASVTYLSIALSAVGEDTARDLQFAPDVGGSPGEWAETLALPDGAYTTPAPFWVRCILAAGTPATPAGEPLTGLDIKLDCMEVPA